MVAALLAGTLLFSSVPTVYGAERDEKVVTEGVETTSEVTDDVQLPEAEESLDTAEPAVQEKQNPAGSVATFEESSEEPEVTPGDDRTPGWNEVDGQKFYLDNDLKRVTGWKLLDGSWYWFDEEGIMQTGWITVNGKRYYLNSDGRMQIGWIQEGDTWYFANGSGEMQTGWNNINGSWYYLGGSNDGAMKTGWISDRGRNYYLNPDGVWKNIRIGVIGNNEAGAITTAVKFIEMGVDATVVTGSFDPSQYDGIVIPGGGDLDPSRYGQANTASKNIDNALDDRQIDAVKKCAQAGKPVFGICKGVQLINVAFGGTLNQNIGGHMGVWHSASVVASGWFSGICSGSVSVLSYHHQSIRDLAPGFQVDMRAGDGTIEAISNNAKHIYGVQFHPEQMNNETGNRCIRQFVVTCTN